MTATHFSIFVGILIVLGIYVSFNIYDNIESRELNFEQIASASSCIELQGYFTKAITFEEKFSNGGQTDLVVNITADKSRELNCD